MQKRVDAFIHQYQLERSAAVRYMDLVSEIGELGKEILKDSDYGQRPYVPSEASRMEVGDCLFSLLALCGEMGIDAEDALKAAMEKYRARFDARGDMGSGR